jgi:Ras-related protein Rab-1A
MTDDRLHEFKVPLFGSSVSGKTTLAEYIAYGRPPESVVPTIGAGYLCRKVLLDQTEVTLQMWDTSGREANRPLASMYMLNACGIILVYDRTSRSDFDSLSYWTSAIKESGAPNACIVLVGNKADLTDRCEVATEEAECFARKHDMMFFEVSGRTGLNVETLFTSLAKAMLLKFHPKQAEDRERAKPSGFGSFFKRLFSRRDKSFCAEILTP